MLEGGVAALRTVTNLFGINEVGEVATGISSESGEKIGAGGRVGRAAVITVGFIPGPRVAANLRRTAKNAQEWMFLLSLLVGSTEQLGK
jgi:hypothetical protein